MRDPEAGLVLGEMKVTRQLRDPLPDGHFLRSKLAIRWVQEGRLVAYEHTSERTLQAPRLPFVSQPTEWCDAQLHDAARFTLDLQSEAVSAGFDLKDASAWNVLFDGTKPVFCDLLSFVPLADRAWWAAGQFSRHFLLPLAVARLKALQARSAFLVSRDGMHPDDARRILGAGRFLTRYWPAMAGGRAQAAIAPVAAGDSLRRIASYRQGLHTTLSWMLDGARSRPKRPSVWADYRDERAHYPDGSVERKRQVVQAWLGRTRPGWVLDLGCNTGEFSQMAVESGARVIALDGDHEAVQALYRSQLGSKSIHPIVATLDDLSGGRGWGGVEHPGLADRLAAQSDMVLMLALVHHLMVSSAIPVEAVAGFVRRCTRRYAVVEWIDEGDPQMLLLCAQRQRQVAEFGIERQRSAFISAGFEVLEEVALTPGTRRLALLELRT